MTIEQKVCIIGGFTEGRHHVRPFVQALKKSSFKITHTIRDADIIVAHSGGCFLLPLGLEGKLVLMINPPCEYDGSIPANTKRKVRIDYREYRARKQTRRHVHKTAWSGAYFFMHGKRHWQMAKRSPEFAIQLPSISARKTVVIAAKNDPWSKNISPETIAANPTYNFLNMAATHDDIWMHPERYVAIIQSIYES